MVSSAIWDAFRGFFALIDSGIYNLIGVVYEIIEVIAKAKIVENTYISDMTNKLYSFIAVFMIFKISFSLINYLINPDSILDKEKGGSKLITNVILTFVLIIIVPFAFDILREAQSAILDDDIIGTIVSGQNSKSFQISKECGDKYVVPGTTQGDPEPEKNYKTGQFIALVTIRPFVQIDQSAKESTIEALITDTGYCKSGKVTDILSNKVITFDNSNKKETYAVNYNLFVSTIVGGAILFILISFTFDIAVRAVKLVFLEIISPIPVMSFIDPTSSKKGLFNKWLKEVGVTWADLFLRLFAVTFSTSLIGAYQFGFGEENSLWIDIIILAGVLMFAKKLPDILKKMFNIDLKGDFKLNPLKKFQEQAIGGKQIMGVATGLASGTLGMTTSFRGNNFKERFANAGKGFKAGLVGGYKSPTSMKGLAAGMQPYKEVRKKQKEAEKQLKEFDDLDSQGEKLINSAIKKSNGKLTADGKKYDIDEAKARMFSNSEYRNSYMEVQGAKKNLKNAQEKAKSTNSELQRILSGNLTEQEKNDINSGKTTYDSLKNAAIKNAADADASVEKLSGILTSKKERHKIVQQQYTADAAKERAMEEYLNRHPDALNVNVDHAEVNSQSNNTDNSSNSNSYSTPNPASQSANQNNANYNMQPEPTGEHHQQFKNYDEIIRDRSEKIEKAQEEYKKLNNSYGGEADQQRNELSQEISAYTEEINKAKTERSRLDEMYPEEAANEIEYHVNNYSAKKVDALRNEFNNLDNNISHAAEIYGDDYAVTDKYSRDKARHDYLAEQIKAKEKEMEAKLEDARRYREKASNTQSTDSNQSQSDSTQSDSQNNRKEYILKELEKYRREESEIKARYGVLNYSKTEEYKEVEAKIRELETEMWHL